MSQSYTMGAALAVALVLSAVPLAGPVHAAEPCAEGPVGPFAEVCVTATPHTPPVNVNASATEECPGLGLNASVSDGYGTVCVLANANGTFQLPRPQLDPDVGPLFPATIVTGPCAEFGNQVGVNFNDSIAVIICVDAMIDGNGKLLAFDIEECPGGVDPRIDVAGFRIIFCVTVTTIFDPPGFGPGDPGQFQPDVDTEKCPEGVDPTVSWLNLTAGFCVGFGASSPSVPDVGTMACPDGEQGVLVEVDRSTLGLCLKDRS